jgi:integral membrane protein (TIGR01906 family)
VLFARWTTTALFVIAVPLFLVLTNVRIAAMWTPVYDYAFTEYDGPARTGIARPELDRAAQEIIAYFQSTEDDLLLDIRVEEDGRQVPLFNQREVLHMSDVRDLFQVVFGVQEVAFAYIVVYIAAVVLWSRERSMRRLARQGIAAGLLAFGALAIGAVGVLVNFDSLFTQFHLLSFANDFWKLSPDRDHLVQMFPQGFWFDVSLAVGVITLLEGALIASIGAGYLAWLDRAQRARFRRSQSTAGVPSAGG